MDVKFIQTTASKLNSLAIINGQIIALSDKSGLYYDLDGVRYNSSYILPTANASVLGGVKLSDTYTSSGGAASSGVAASSYAVYKAYSTLNNSISSITKKVTTAVSTLLNGRDVQWNLERCGSLVTMTCPSIFSISESELNCEYNLGNLIPSGYRPSMLMFGVTHAICNCVAVGQLRFQYYSNGRINMFANTLGLQEGWHSLTWITHDAMPS